MCVYVLNMDVHVVYVGVQVFKTSILYEIDKDDSIGATNAIGKASGSHLIKLVYVHTHVFCCFFCMLIS